MNVLIINLHSALNLGDDAIMQVTLRSIKNIFPNVHITVAANDPDSWRKYPDVEVVHSLCTWMGDCKLGHFRSRFPLLPFYSIALLIASVLYRAFERKLFFGSEDQRQLLRAYYEANLILSCGGGNFYSYRPASPSFILGLLALAFALMLGKKAIMLPQSIGPINGISQRFFARQVFERVTHIIVREPFSQAFIKSNLGMKKGIILFPDLAFGLPSQYPEQGVQTKTEKDTYHIGITMIDRGAQKAFFKSQEHYENLIVSLLARLNQERRAHIHLFCQCTGPSSDQDDRIIARRILQRLSKDITRTTLHENFKDAFEIQAAYKLMDCVIGTRLHTAIFALSCGVPVILIGYQPKALGTMKLLGLERYYYDIDNLQGEQLYQLVNDILERRNQISIEISDVYAKAQKSLEGWTSYLKP